jgi:hypothetical protein
MASKENQTTLPGFTAAETVILAAAYFHARSADVSETFIAPMIRPYIVLYTTPTLPH